MRFVPDNLGTIGVDLIGHVLYPIYMPNSFEDVIELFGGPTAFARAVGMSVGCAKQSKRRGSISPAWYSATTLAAKKAGLNGLDEQALAKIAAAKRGRAA